MKVTVTGSLGNISRILVEKLVAQGHAVKVVSSNPDRVREIESLEAIACIGSVEDYQFIKQSFQGSDAVYLMIPPSFGTADLKQYIRTVGSQYARALRETGVKFAVYLSSVGSDIENGLGPTGPNFYVEQQLNGLPDTHVLHLRPGMFLTNFYGAIPTIKNQGMLGNNFGGSVMLPLSHPRDIAEAAFNAIDQLRVSGKQVRYIVSDEKTSFELTQVLGNAVGKPGLTWVEFSDEQLFNMLLQNGFSEQMATVYIVEIGAALRDGSFTEDYNKQKKSSGSGTTMEDFAREFALAYHYSN
jgi:uncharacterized protein YbjT (DUF2867 family)